MATTLVIKIAQAQPSLFVENLGKLQGYGALPPVTPPVPVISGFASGFSVGFGA